MKPRQIDIHIERIALGARVPGSERSLRDALARELASFARESYGRPQARSLEARPGAGAPALARQVRTQIAREAKL